MAVNATALPPLERPSRIAIHDLEPRIGDGRHATKLALGDTVQVSATIVRDGHESLRAVVRGRSPDGEWVETPMQELPGTDRWVAHVTPQQLGEYAFQVCAWVDRYSSWHHEMRRRIDGGQLDLKSELLEGAVLLAQVDVEGADAAIVEKTAKLLRGRSAQAKKVAAALDPALRAVVATDRSRPEFVSSPAHRIDVDAVLATFGAWYELFPRSWGGFRALTEQVGDFADLGIDVLYFPPIHPIGITHRKGPNNTLVAGPNDPGSPWAIGGTDGGHDAIHRELGSEDEFIQLVQAARERGISIALDLALQCSPDHPWLNEHPEWFSRRPDGTLKYAENPPKKYQDIYNLDFDSQNWRELWQALADVVRHWVGLGVTVFRVDNPHTKPLPFWEWLIGTVRIDHPEVIFLAEAFTRPAMMFELAKVGFNQSYTYFTWRNGRQDLTEYVTELADPQRARVFRPNFFANTPDILHEYLQHGGPPAFHARLVLAATLSPSYGIYSGFESFENVPVRLGSEEYLDSEKYQMKHRRLDGPLLEVVRRLNITRRSHRALQRIAPVRFVETENDHLIAYVRGSGDDSVICVVNLDPHTDRVGLVHLAELDDLPDTFPAVDHLDDQIYTWHRGGNYVALPPGGAHVLSIRRYA